MGGRKLLAAAGAFALALVGSIGAVSSHAALGDVGNDGAIDADAIAAGVIDNAIQLSNSAGAGKDVISGRAQIVNPRGGGQLTSTYNAFEPVDASIPVYVQWIDRDGAVSPIYSAHTHELPGAAGAGGKGMYAFKLPTWTDHLGKEHRFTTSIDQRYRVFSSAQPVNPKTGNKLSLLRTAPGYTPYAFGKGSGDGLGDFPMAVATNGNMTRTGLWFFEKPEDYVKHANPIEDPKGPLGNPQVHYENDALKTFSGNVWLELGNERQLLTGATLTRDPAPSDGYTVWASTLTAEGKAAYEAHVNSKPEVIQAEAAKELLTQHPEYIAATVYGPVVDGKYTLRFPEDKYEQRYVYMWVEDPDGRVVTAYSTFTQPEFQDPRNNLQWSPAMDPAKNNAGLVGKDFERYYNINFAIVHQEYAELDITNFDNTNKPAYPGAVAKLTLTGNLSPLPSKIEWRGPDGTVLKSCDITSTANLNGCESFEVPEDAQHGDFYTAVLVSGDQDVAADSFIVNTETDGDSDNDGVEDGNDQCPNTPAGAKVDENGCSVAPTLDLKPIEGTVGQPIDPVEIGIDNPGEADIVECEVEGLPDGLKAEINAERTACVITGTPTAPIDNGTVTVNVDYQSADSDDPKMVTGDTTVTITKPEAGDDDGDGVPNPADPNNPAEGEDKCPNTPAGAKVDENGCSVAPTVTLNPTEITGKVGQEIDPVVVKIDNPGKVEITSCKADGLPAGLVAELNSEGTGCVIHGTPTEEADGKPVTITVGYQPKDSDTPGSVEKNTTAIIVKEPKWDDAETTPSKPVEIENTGGKVPDGSSVEVTDGPGTAEIGDDGTITVTPNEDAKPGDKIVVEVKDPEGNKIDEVTVEVVADTQHVTHGVKVDGKVIDSNGDGTDNGAELIKEGARGYDLSGLQVKLIAKDGTAEFDSGDATQWVGAKGSPVVKNFGLADVPAGEYTVEITGYDTGANKWIYLAPNSQLKPGGTVTITGDTANLFVEFLTKKDADGDGVPDPVDPNNPAEGEDKCPNTPKDAEVDADGCSEAPKWDDAETTPSKPVEIENTGGKVPDGSSVEVTDGPGTAEIGDDGTITVTPNEDAKPGDKIVVEVKDPDGNVIDTVVVEIVKPDPTQADEFEPGYEDGSGKPGEDVTVPAPEFKDKDGNPTDAPEGTTFTPGDNAPDGVTIDENTGEITVTIPEDATPGDKITVPVTVTYPDGSTDEVEVTVTVEQPDAPADQPDWKDDSGKPGEKVEIPNTGGDVPDGSTVETEGPGKAEIDEDGNLVVDIDEDANPGDKIVVIVKDKDGNEIDRVVVEVEKPDAPETEKPDWKDGKTTPDKPIVIPNEGGDVPEGSTVEVTGPGTAEIGKDGSITVTPSDKAKVGDKIVVVVKDKDGNVLDTITVEITEGALKPGKPRPGMPSTGADDSAAGAMALGGVLAAMAAGVAAARRRRD